MIEETLVKTHLIVTDIHEEYEIKWLGKLVNTKPVLKDERPIFTIVSGDTRVELNTSNMKFIEDTAKNIAHPRGRASTTTDTSRIYIKEVGEVDTLIGIVVHKRVKQYSQMFDKVGYR